MFVDMNPDNTGGVLFLSLPAVRADGRGLVILSPGMNVLVSGLEFYLIQSWSVFFRFELRPSDFPWRLQETKLWKRGDFPPETGNYRPLKDKYINDGSGKLRAAVCFSEPMHGFLSLGKKMLLFIFRWSRNLKISSVV